jgi:hypothetical protein
MTDIGLTRGISETKLSRSLDALVEDCVNAVGVDASTASAPLLARVSGIGAGLAQISSCTAMLMVRSALEKMCPGWVRRRSSNVPVSCALRTT